MKKLLLGSLFTVFALIALLAFCQQMATVPITPDFPDGTEAYLFAPAADKEVAVAIDEAAFDELHAAFRTKDWHGVAELFLSNRAFGAETNSRVLIIDRAFGKKKVRVLEGKQTGRAGWVKVEYLKR